MVLRWFGELIAPSRCSACDEPNDGAPFCAACDVSVEIADGGDGGAAFLYGGAVADAIRRMKYEGRSDLAGRLGEAMADVLEARARGGHVRAVDLVVPVPMHALRVVERGYNHAALLARPLARAFSARLAARALERLRHTPRQASLDRRRRLENVVGAFAVRASQRALVAGARIGLVDDVRTTGATLAECAAVLMASGAARVVPWVLAAREDELYGDR